MNIGYKLGAIANLPMKRILVIATALLIISLASTTSSYNIHAVHASASAYIDPLLASAQAASSPSTAAQVIVVLNQTPEDSGSTAFPESAINFLVRLVQNNWVIL